MKPRWWLFSLFAGAIASAQPGASKSRPMTDPNVGYDHSPSHIVTVRIVGAVNKPGEYRLPASQTAWDAIEAAGSFTPVAIRNDVRLERTIEGLKHIFGLAWDQREKAPFPVLLRDGDIVTVAVPPPDLIPGFIAKVRFISPSQFPLEGDGVAGFIRFDPKLRFENISKAVLNVPSWERGNYTTALLVQLTIIAADGAICEARTEETKPPEVQEWTPVAPDEERLFALPAAYRIKVPGPGKYRASATVSFSPPRQFTKYISVKSEEMEIEVMPAAASASPDSQAGN